MSLLAWQSAENTLRFEASTPAAVTRTLSLLNPGPMPALLGTTTVLGPGASRFKVERGCPAGSVMPAGTTCELVLSFVPSLLPAEEATLQLRSDQSNPASVRLVSATPPAAPAPVEPAAAMDVSGGCSAGPPQRRAMDPLLLAVLLAAAAAMFARRRQR